MPTYLFLNRETGEEWTEFMSISQAEEFLLSNPRVERLVNGAPHIGDPYHHRPKKPDDAFRDILREVKKEHPGSTINTM